jgi:hypothetical protein
MLNTAFLTMAALLVSVLAARDAAASQLTLSFDPAQSHIAISGTFSDVPFQPQDTDPVLPGSIDLNPSMNSMDTSFGGTITIEVDGVNSPSAIKILSSVADANVGGQWLPKQFPPQDLDMDGTCCEFGDDSDPAAAAPPGPAEDGDWGFWIRHPAFGVNAATGAARDIVFNITSPVEAVAGGQFSSLTENFEFATGWLDYWVHPVAGGVQGRAELAGGDDDNLAGPSTYMVTLLPGNQKEYKLIIPVNIDSPGDDADFFYDGQLVATLVVPEPSAIVMLCVGLLTSLFARRKRM